MRSTSDLGLAVALVHPGRTQRLHDRTGLGGRQQMVNWGMSPEEFDALVDWLDRALTLHGRAAASDAEKHRIAAESRIYERCVSTMVNARVEPESALDAPGLAEHVLAELAYGRRRDVPGWQAAWLPDGLTEEEQRHAHDE